MTKHLYKHTNVDVILFLKEQMECNTEHFQSDFEIDKNMIHRFSASQSKEDKSLLWMSRPMGTHLQRERETFIRDTYDHNTWKFYAEQTHDRIVAFAVELTGKKDGIIRGNVYELDYPAHAALVSRQAVPALDVEKTFENGFVDRVPLRKGTHSYHMALIDQHGPIIKSRTISEDEERLGEILAEQKKAREKMKELPDLCSGDVSIDEQIALAEGKKGPMKASKNLKMDFVK